MKKAYAYIRVSTDGQTGEDEYGIPAQEEVIRNYASANDIEVVEYYIESASGVDSQRPALYELMSNLSDEINYVLIAKCDRLARDLQLYFYFKYKIQTSGAELLSVSDNFSVFGEYAPLLESFTAFFASMDRKNIALRLSGGRNAKAKQGGYAGGSTAYGYDVEYGELVINEEEAKTVRSIFNARARGILDTCTGIKKASYENILEMLRLSGAKSKKGGEIGKSSLQTIFAHEPLYFGYYKYGSNDWVKGKHEPILTDKRLMTRKTRDLLGIK